ncbi:MAG: NAD(+)/NADH kinase [Deltaproteobacteria bacterium]|nr:NAD(+)/NADH kinase [Deltaproteobacteria bacterium]
MKYAGIVLKITHPQIEQIFHQIIGELGHYHIKAYLDEASARKLQYGDILTQDTAKLIDFLIVAGGDGTFLRSMDFITSKEKPVVGINLSGSLGFITEITLEELRETLSDIVNETYKYIYKSRLRCSVIRDYKMLTCADVLNEAAIIRNSLTPIVNFDVWVDNLYLSKIKADGIIVATPTGSTAYNMAVNGPILHPETEGVIINAVSPHMLSFRPIILPAGVKIKVRISKAIGPLYASFDGQRGIELLSMDEIKIEKSNFPVKVVQSRRRDFFDIIRTKLKWGEK